jgi:hypothetical protein
MAPKSFLIILFVLFISPACSSQNNITGIWEGKFLSAVIGLGQPKLVVEIYNFKDSLFTGITHLYYEGNMYEHYKMVGWYSKKDSLLVFKEASTIAVDLGSYGNCLGTYTTVLQKKGSSMFQYGLWRSNIKGCTADAKIWLKKNIDEVKKVPDLAKRKPLINKPIPVADSLKNKILIPVNTIIPSIPVVKNAPVIKDPPFTMPEKIARRETDVQSLIEIAPADKDSIKVEIYDNGEIDGDSVSVYEGEVLRINKKMISLKPLTFYVSLNKNINPITHLRLVAESLGTIPPCTALMIVTTKSKRYEVHLSSNFSKTATVELFLKE